MHIFPVIIIIIIIIEIVLVSIHSPSVVSCCSLVCHSILLIKTFTCSIDQNVLLANMFYELDDLPIFPIRVFWRIDFTFLH